MRHHVAGRGSAARRPPLTAWSQLGRSSPNSFAPVNQSNREWGRRRRVGKNRGFEGVATQRFHGRTYVYTALQSPMENPDTTTHNSLAIRVFRIDVSDADKPIVDREWAALLDPKPGKKSPLSDKVSALWPAGPDKLLIEERDDTVSSDPSASTRI